MTDYDIDEVRGRIGSIVVVWSDFERSITKVCADATRSPSMKKLEKWCELVRTRVTNADAVSWVQMVLDEARVFARLRNGVCHGFRGYRARSDAEICYELDGELISIGIPEIDAACSRIMKTSRFMDLLNLCVGDPSNVPQVRSLFESEWPRNAVAP